MSVPAPFEIAFKWSPEIYHRFSKTVRNSRREKLLDCCLPAALAGLLVLVGALVIRYLPQIEKSSIFNGYVAGLIVGAMLIWFHQWLLKRAEMRRTQLAWDAMAKVTIRFGPDGVAAKSAQASDEYGWSLVWDVVPMPTGLGLNVLGRTVTPIPDESLPQGITRDEAFARINAWRSA